MCGDYRSLQICTTNREGVFLIRVERNSNIKATLSPIKGSCLGKDYRKRRGERSATLRPTAVGAALAAAGIDELATTVGAGFAGLGTILDVAFQRASDTVGPSGNGIDIEIEFANQFDHIGDGHTMAEDARNEFGVIPVFFFKHTGKALHGDLVAVLVEELEIVACMFIARFLGTDYPSFLDPFGQDETIGLTGEDFVRTSFEHTDHGNPILALILEANDFSIKSFGTLRRLRLCEMVIVALFAFGIRDEDAVT